MCVCVCVLSYEGWRREQTGGLHSSASPSSCTPGTRAATCLRGFQYPPQVCVCVFVCQCRLLCLPKECSSLYLYVCLVITYTLYTHAHGGRRSLKRLERVLHLQLLPKKKKRQQKKPKQKKPHSELEQSGQMMALSSRGVPSSKALGAPPPLPAPSGAILLDAGVTNNVCFQPYVQLCAKEARFISKERPPRIDEASPGREQPISRAR